MIRYLAATGLGTLALLPLAGCSAGAQPLVSLGSKAVQVCAPAPGPPVTGISAWDSPIGFVVSSFYNASAAPLEIEAVSLLDAHNVILHRVVVYEARRELNQMVGGAAWRRAGVGADRADWARRQAVPGAVISPDPPGAGPTTHDAYQLVLDISAKTPAGGYAAGEQVTYRQGNARYAIRAYAGYVISPPTPKRDDGTRCAAYEQAVQAAWQESG
jgi:hypothetical protein